MIVGCNLNYDWSTVSIVLLDLEVIVAYGAEITIKVNRLRVSGNTKSGNIRSQFGKRGISMPLIKDRKDCSINDAVVSFANLDIPGDSGS